MQIFKKLNKNKNLAVALGFFDGVHIGHQKVIKSAVNYAQKNGLKSAVITFKDHPCCYFYDVCPKYILTREERQNKIADLGVDYMYELDFNKELAKLDANEYLQEVLMKYFSPKSISTGFNHYFGSNKSGNADFLRKNQEKYGYKYFEISPQQIENEIISSTEIRKCLTEGKIEKANKMLGRNFAVKGEIIEGEKLGRILGYKTANTLFPPELVNIPFGVYETKTNYGKSITNFGIKPTVNSNKNAVLETHILNFDKNIYGEVINIEFLNMIRKEKKFNSIDDLAEQIKRDVESIK